jgi:predicted transcriptional regulator
MKISKIIQEKIKENGMTVKDLAKEIDVPYTTFLGILNRGLAKADVQIFIKICTVLGEKPEEMIKLIYDDNYYADYQEEKLKKTLREFGMPENILDTMNDNDKEKFIEAIKNMTKKK